MTKRLSLSLLLLRLGVFVVMLVWALDKFFRPEHASQVFEIFYFSPAFGPNVAYAIGAAQLVVVIGFVLGVLKLWTYGLVLLMHTVSTFTSYAQYLAPYQDGNILFFAAWPMWAACVALFLMRDEDNMLTVNLS